MKNDVNWTLLAKYFFGECSEEEEARVRAWIERDPNRAALIRQLRQALVNEGEAASSKEWDTDGLWERVREQTQPEEGGGSPSSFRSPSTSASREGRQPEDRRRERRRGRPGRQLTARHAVWGSAIALMLAITVIGALWQRGIQDSGVRTMSMQGADTFTTQKSERAIIRLTDGTRVQLNVDSRLTVPPGFGEKERRITLEGEAFFEVETDSTRPFIVQSGDLTTRVLGTAFDVTAYPEEETQVAVSEGKVSLQTGSGEGGQEEDSTTEESVVLTKQQMARITQRGNQIIRRESDVRQHLAWMEGHLVLRKASFREVVQKLERWYDLKISLVEGEAPPGHLNSRFAKDQPLDEVLSVVATAFGLEYQRRQKRVTLSSSGNSHLQ